jgi:hypothetical protein
MKGTFLINSVFPRENGINEECPRFVFNVECPRFRVPVFEIDRHGLLTGKRLTLRITVTIDDMVVDQAGRLHVRIDDRAADEFEPALF